MVSKRMAARSPRTESSIEHDLRFKRIAAEVLLRKGALEEALHPVPVWDTVVMRNGTWFP